MPDMLNALIPCLCSLSNIRTPDTSEPALITFTTLYEPPKNTFVITAASNKAGA